MTDGRTTPTIPPPLPPGLAVQADRDPRSKTQQVPSARFELEDLLTGKNLFRLGLGLLLLGFVFLFRHAIEENWIGPAARVAAGAVTSAALIGIGLRVTDRRPTYGQLLQGGGVAGLYLTAFAAHRVYEMIDETSALVQLAVVSAIGVGLAVRARSELLASVSVVGALAAPLLIGGRMVGFGGDALYLAVVLAAIVALFLRFEWSRLWWIAQAGATLMAGTDLVRLQLDLANAPSALELQLVLVAMWVTFYMVPVAARSLGRLSDGSTAAGGTVATTFAVFALSYLVWAPSADRTFAFVAGGMALFHLGARFVLVSSEEHELADLQMVPAAVFAGVAAVLAFDGPILSLLLAAEAAAVALVARRLGNSLATYGGHAAFALVALGESLRMWGESTSGVPVFNGPALARLAILGIAAGLALSLDREGDRDELFSMLRMGYAAYAFAGLLGLLTVELLPIGQGAVTAAWGTVGVAATVAGTIADRRKVRLLGVGTILVAVGKLFTIDLASVEPIWRILLFAGFGLVLLVVGYWMSNDE